MEGFKPMSKHLACFKTGGHVTAKKAGGAMKKKDGGSCYKKGGKVAKKAEGGAMDDDRRIAARAVQMRLDDLQGEAGGGGGVEGIAAAFQHRHADLAGDPMGGGDGAEGASDFRAGGEHGRSILSRFQD